MAITLPGGIEISSPVKTGPGTSIPEASLGGILSGLLTVILFVGGFLMVFWAAWGVFQYIFAGGNKERLGKARSRITWAIVGFIFLVLAFSLRQYIETLIPHQQPEITPISIPGPLPK